MKLKSIFYGILAIAFILVAASMFLSYAGEQIVEDIESKHKERFLAFAIADEFRHTSMDLTRFARTYAATGEQRYYDDYMNIVNWRNGDSPRPDNVHKDLRPGETVEQRQIMRDVGFSDEEFNMLDNIANMSNNLIKLETQAMESVKQGKIVDGPARAYKNEWLTDFAVRILYNDTYHTEVYKIWGTVGDFVTQLDERIFKEIEEEERFYHMLSYFRMVIQILIALGVTLLAIYMISSVLGRQLGGEPREIARNVQRVSEGELNIYFNTRQTSGVYASLKTMVHKLSEIVSIVTSGSEQIVSASSQLASGNQDLSTRTEQQATALEETSSAIEEMNSSIRSNADNTSTANKLSQDVVQKTEEGATAVNQMIQSMNEISESSNRIADIIEVINNIAFQTNLLALNASIEAARAGEQGKGFAVVAVEVRKLAKRSDKAAAEITDIIKTSNTKVNDGVDIANKAGSMLTDINNAVKKVTVLIGEISAASQEQLSSVDQIDRTLSSLDENTQKNAALVEEAASATEQLSAQALELNRNMQFFKLNTNTNPVFIPVAEQTAVYDTFTEDKEKPKTESVPAVPEKTSEPPAVKSENMDTYETFSNLVDEDQFKEF